MRFRVITHDGEVIGSADAPKHLCDKYERDGASYIIEARFWWIDATVARVLPGWAPNPPKRIIDL